jgi:hypothetical protein
VVENPGSHHLNGTKREFIGLIFVYTNILEREMSNSLDFGDGEQFAKGQDRRDLQVCYDAADVETQFMDGIDSVYDLFRFLRVSARGMANNQLR